ncbi:hypothetical protein LXL04_015284 [Taraxacum kok-saghyz]
MLHEPHNIILYERPNVFEKSESEPVWPRGILATTIPYYPKSVSASIIVLSGLSFTDPGCGFSNPLTLISMKKDTRMKVNMTKALVFTTFLMFLMVIGTELVIADDFCEKTYFQPQNCVDLDKAFDSLNWRYLDSIMEQMEFNWKWIMGCLTSGRGSVLVNGSPTKEFNFRKGVRQGDPLAPFLFVLAMEGLSVTMRSACHNHLFRGINLPNNGPSLSHLMYADDVTFIGEWSDVNLVNLNRILCCFHMASGLKVNLGKSKEKEVAILGKLQEHELIFKGTQGLEVKLKKIEVFKGNEVSGILPLYPRKEHGRGPEAEAPTERSRWPTPGEVFACKDR